ncbi:MAG: hypothetical protein K2K92_04420, partial [Duncaniella sp.]|nr:hypothetical protein [Duncaniella sp.]
MKVTKEITRHIDLLRLTPLAVSALLAFSPAAQTIDSTDKETYEMLSGQVEIPGDADDIDIPIPSFINKGANHILLNGADWGRVKQAFLSSRKSPVTIVHIGDSHVQADISTGTTRELLQYDFGNAGRGLVSPLKMSGTNEPRDYVFQSRNSWNPAKLMSANWRHTMGFTGTSIRPVTNSAEITIATSDKEDYNPFSSLTIFHNGKLNVTSVTDENDEKVEYRTLPSHDYTQILLGAPSSKVTINFSSAGDLTVYGASLSGDRPGLFYHAIGNNGATYDTYNRIGNVGTGISPLSPDLVIISLGTNEAFGKLSTSALTQAIDRLVKNIKQANPQAQILLTTPMECQRSKTTVKKVRVKGKNGRRRTVNRTSRTYIINPNIATVRGAILDYAGDNQIAVWDWWKVAGGQGASSSWIRHGLFANDRVHHSYQVYNLEGSLIYAALM